MTLVLSLVLQTPTSLSARSNMLLRREMMMNCASLVRFLMQSATIATFLKSSAASISSIKYSGVGLQQCSAKISERELSVFSPPDSLFTSFQLFFGGRTLKLTPSLKGSSESISSSSASPPRVRCWQTSFSFEFITPKPSRKRRRRSSLRASMMRLSSCWRSRTASNSLSLSRQCAYLFLNSLMISRLLPSIFLRSADSAVMMPKSLSLKQEKCSIWSSLSSSSGLVRSSSSTWKMRGWLASREELSMEVSKMEELLGSGRSREGLSPCARLIFSMSSRSSRKEQLVLSSRQFLRTFSSSSSQLRSSSLFFLCPSSATSTSRRAFSTFALLSRTSLSSSSISRRSSPSVFLHSRTRSSQAVILPMISETFFSSSICWPLKLSISRLEVSVRRSLSTFPFFTSQMRRSEFSRMAFSLSNSFSIADTSPFSCLYRSRSSITGRAYPFFCSSSSPRKTSYSSARAFSIRSISFPRSSASRSCACVALPLFSVLASMSLMSFASSSYSLMFSITEASSRFICSMSLEVFFTSASSQFSLRVISSSSPVTSFLRASNSLACPSCGLLLPLVVALGTKPPRRGALPTINPFISYTMQPLRFLLREMTRRRWCSFFMEYSRPRSESSQYNVSLRAKQKASLASSERNLTRSKRRTARGRFSKGRFMQLRYSPIFSRMMQVARPSLRALRKSSTAAAVGRSVTTMLSSREQQVVITSSCSFETSPRSPSRPSTPGKPCCMTSRNMLPICPCSSLCERCSRRSPSSFRISPRRSSRCRFSSKTRSCRSRVIFSAMPRAFSIFSRTSPLAFAFAWQSRSFPSSSPRPDFARPSACRTFSSLPLKLPASRSCRESSISQSRIFWRSCGFSCLASSLRIASRAAVRTARASLEAGSLWRISSHCVIMRVSSRSASCALRSNLTRSSLLKAISCVRCLSSTCNLLQLSWSFSRCFCTSSCSPLFFLISRMRSACVFSRSRSSATMRSLLRSSSAASSRSRFASSRARAVRTWLQTFWAWKTFFSFLTQRTASSLALLIPRSSFSTSRISCPFSCFCSSAAEYSRAHSSMRSMNCAEPMISSRYSSSPGLSRSPDFCRICEICSTSPCRIRKRLLPRSMPSVRSRSFTSACELSRPSMKYFDRLAAFTVRRIQNSDPGTSTSCPPGSSCSFLKWTSTAARALPVEELELWMSWLSLLRRIQLALKPKMKSMLSMRLDLPEPFGPTTLVKLPWNLPITCFPAYDLKSSSTMWSITSRGFRSRATFRLTTRATRSAAYAFAGFSSGASRSSPSMPSLLSDSSCMCKCL